MSTSTPIVGPGYAGLWCGGLWCQPRWSVMPPATPTPPTEPITVPQLLERARIVPGDEEDTTLYGDYITAARAQIEFDTGLAVVDQVIECYADWLPWGVFTVPWPPLVAVQAFDWMDQAGTITPIDLSALVIDVSSRPARLLWSGAVAWPTTVRPLAGWHLQLRVGYQTVPPGLVQAVGLLATHLATTGRDLVVEGRINQPSDMPMGYEDTIGPFRLPVLV